MSSLPSVLAAKLSEKYLLLDTNFLIDVYKQPKFFRPIVDTLQQRGVGLYTIGPVAAEFLRGLKSIDEYEDRLDTLQTIVRKIILLKPEVDQVLLADTVRLYLLNGARTSLADLYLATMLIRRSGGDTLLLTADIKGFPPNLFNLVDLLPVETGSDIRIYGIFQFPGDKLTREKVS